MLSYASLYKPNMKGSLKRAVLKSYFLLIYITLEKRTIISSLSVVTQTCALQLERLILLILNRKVQDGEEGKTLAYNIIVGRSCLLDNKQIDLFMFRKYQIMPQCSESNY